MNYFKRFETILIIVVILVLGAAYGLLSSKQAAQETPNTQPSAADQAQQQVPSNQIQYPGQEGKTAMELLKELHRVETQSFGDLGEMVQSINGIEPDGSHFWSFYVNGEQAQVGASAYVTKSSDTIEWKLEEIQ